MIQAIGKGAGISLTRKSLTEPFSGSSYYWGAPQAQYMSHIDITIKKASALLHWSICLVGFHGVYEMCFPVRNAVQDL